MRLKRLLCVFPFPFLFNVCLSFPIYQMDFPDGSVGKESACNAKTWVRSLGWEDPLEEGMATHSSILAWRIPMDRGAW